MEEALKRHASIIAVILSLTHRLDGSMSSSKLPFNSLMDPDFKSTKSTSKESYKNTLTTGLHRVARLFKDGITLHITQRLCPILIICIGTAK